MTNVNNDNAAIHAAVSNVAVKKADYQSAVTAKNAAIERARRLAARAKTHANYTETIGRQLGIEVEGAAPAPGPDKPDLKADSVLPKEVIISWAKGAYDGMEIRSKRNEADKLELLAIDMHSPYVDNRPNADPTKPERRYYQGRYMDGDTPTGPVSDLLVVTVPAE